MQLQICHADELAEWLLGCCINTLRLKAMSFDNFWRAWEKSNRKFANILPSPWGVTCLTCCVLLKSCSPDKCFDREQRFEKFWVGLFSFPPSDSVKRRFLFVAMVKFVLGTATSMKLRQVSQGYILLAKQVDTGIK